MESELLVNNEKNNIIEKRKKSFNKKRDKKILEKQEIIEKIQKQSKDMLIINLKEQTKKLTKYIVDLLNEKVE